MPWQMSHHLLFVMDRADTPHVCLFFFCGVDFAISSLNLQPKSLQDKEVDSLADSRSARIHPPLLSFRRSRLLSTLSPLSLSFSPSRFCEESREERQIRLPPQKLPITAWQRVQHCCLANAEFVNPGSTAANMWAQFWACRFKWVQRRGVAIYRRSSGIWNKLRRGCSWFLHLKWVRSQGIHHRQRSTPDLYWLTIPQYIYI